jgi:hypothetical protein
MWKYLILVCFCLAMTQQAASATGNSLIVFSKFDYTNQTMGDLGLPEENYSPSNFYTLSLVKKQRVVALI